MKNKKKAIILFSAAIFILFAFFVPDVYQAAKWKIISAEVKAAGAGFPYQIGLTSVIITKCFTTVLPPTCNGGILCPTKDFATCTMYSEASGMPAGGMGMNALFLNTAIAQAGLMPGGQLIAAGMSPVLMDSGVLASAGGCSGCMAKADENFLEKTFALFDKYVVAGFLKKIDKL